MTTTTYRRIGRASVEIVLVLVPMFIVGCSVALLLP